MKLMLQFCLVLTVCFFSCQKEGGLIYEARSGIDSLRILAQTNVVNVVVHQNVSGLYYIPSITNVNDALGDTVKFRFYVSGQSTPANDSIYKQFYFQNDSLHILFSYYPFANDSLSQNFRVLSKTMMSPALPQYAAVDSMIISKSSLKMVGIDYDF